MAEMDIQAYRASSMREALSLVRADLGDDALIVSQEQEGDGICIRACLDLQTASEDVVVPERRTEDRPAQPRPSASKRLRVSADTDWSIADLRFAGLELGNLSGAYRFVGAGGVGKTSLIVRAAARHVARHGASGLAIVSTDTRRLGGNETLALACQALDIRFIECAGPRLRETLASLLDASLVLIDSAAFDPSDDDCPPRLPGVREVCVLSALHAETSLDAQLKRLDVDVGGFCALTHCDHVFDRAALLRWLARRGVTVMAFSHSARLPDGLSEADAETAQRFLQASPSSISVSL